MEFIIEYVFCFYNIWVDLKGMGWGGGGGGGLGGCGWIFFEMLD